jgi:hypothetical protein
MCYEQRRRFGICIFYVRDTDLTDTKRDNFHRNPLLQRRSSGKIKDKFVRQVSRENCSARIIHYPFCVCV